MLAPTVALAPADLRFGRESKGRPFLTQAGAPDFNLSDTTGGSLIALVGRGRIGVDLERLDRDPPVQRLAGRWFSEAEAQALAAMDAERARATFLRLWTAKEASCKATGTGIYGWLPQWVFDAISEQPVLQGLPEHAGAAALWRFLRLSPSDEHTAVLAMQAVPDYRLCALVLDADTADGATTQ